MDTNRQKSVKKAIYDGISDMTPYQNQLVFL